jgi:DNA modification methylase
MDVLFRETFAEAGFKPAEIIVWVKDQFAFGRQDYHWRHEPIIYGWKEGAAHYFIDDHTQDTVWQIDRPKQSESHPTMKPVELCEKAIRNSSRVNQVIADLFGGSGSTLIACEKLNRKCYMMEIDEHYCDVIIERWQNFTGKKAELIDGR